MFKTKFYVNLMKEDRNWCNEMSMNTMPLVGHWKRERRFKL